MRRGKYCLDFENITKAEWFYRTFMMNFKDVEYQENGLYFPNISLKLQVIVPETQEDSIKAFFVFTHPDFFEPMIDAINGYGNTISEQLKSIVYHVLYSVIPVILDSLSSTSKNTLSAFILEQEHIFEIHCGNLYLNGDIKNNRLPDFWTRYQNDIIKRLGTKNIYWIKFYADRRQLNTDCEVSINDEIILDLTSNLKQYLSSSDFDGIDVLKQVIMLVQIPKTRISYPFTRIDITKFTSEAIHLFESGLEYDSIYDRLFSIIQDEHLALELFYLIPELYCGIIFPSVPCTEAFYLYDSDTHLIYPSQLRSYQHIEKTIYEHIQEDKPSQEEIMNVIGVSSRLHAMNAALEKGSDLKDVTMASFAIPTSGFYIVR